jgi:hypothetical protein
MANYIPSNNTKKYFALLILFFSLFELKAQELKPNPFGQKYRDNEFSALKVIQVIDVCGFKSLSTNDSRKFRSLILQLSDKAYTQLNIDTWYLCSYKHEENFQIYNMYYKNVSKNYYDENCKALIALMICDGTIKQPK